MTETAEPTVGVPEDAHSDAEFRRGLENVFRQAQEAGELQPDEPVDFGPYQDESDTLFVRKEFTLDEFERWYAVQGLGGRPFNAIGYHHTEGPTPDVWAGLSSLDWIFNFYHTDPERLWPFGVGPHLWLYSGEGDYKRGEARVCVATHPAQNGVGIEDRNDRWLHIEHIWNGDFAPFSDALKRASGRLLGILCAPHPNAQRRIPLTFLRDSGVESPDQPLGILYHRDRALNWRPGDWPKTCPGLLVTHENLDADLERYAGEHDRPTPKKITIKAEAGDLVAATGAVARDAPRRNAGGNARQLDKGKTYETTGYTEGGEEIEGSTRWYQLNNRKWVHASGGTYTKLPGGVRDFKADERRLTVGTVQASVRPGPSRDSGELIDSLEAGSTHKVDGFTDKGQEIDGVSRWYRLDGDAGWVHASGWALAAHRIMAGPLPRAGGAWETLDGMNDEIADAGEKTGVPPHLIKAMLAREGSFGKDWGKPPVFFEGRPSEVLPFNGIFRSTAESRGIDFDKMCRERPYAIWAMGEVLRQIKEQQAGTPGFTIWDDVAGFYFGGPNWNNPDWGDEIGNTVESYKYHPEGGVIVRMTKLDALPR